MIEKEKPEEKEKNKLNSFFMICIKTIIGYFVNLILIMFIGRYYKEETDRLKEIGWGEDLDCI